MSAKGHYRIRALQQMASLFDQLVSTLQERSRRA